ncbi:MAG: hypothetical protein IKZ37_09130 [Bacteroidaceae bacterium]|nr:hypothetical protein [Bacteroidaceae bacterium]
MSYTNEKEALKYHSKGRAGKTEVIPTKPADSAESIALAYSPGASFPSHSIGKEKWNAYRYTNKGNLVGVLSDGASPLATKPLMEGKSMLLKQFADIDAFDIEITDKDDDTLTGIIQSIAPTFGAISIGGIKSRDGLALQEKLQKLLDIPVLHDEAYGAAVCIAAAFTNYLKRTGKEAAETRTALIGSGTTARAATQLLGSGILHIESTDKAEATAVCGYDFIICTDTQQTPAPSLFGSIVPDAAIIILSPFCDYDAMRKAYPRATLLTGNILQPGYIGSILASPYLFRGALDTLSASINNSMTEAAIKSLASLAAESKDAPLLPRYNDTRLATEISAAVAQAAIGSGVARRNITNWEEYRQTLLSRLERIYNMTGHIKHYGNSNHRLHRRYTRAAPEY